MLTFAVSGYITNPICCTHFKSVQAAWHIVVSVNINVHQGPLLTCCGLAVVLNVWTSPPSCTSSAGQYSCQPGLFLRPQQCSLPELELRYLQCTCCWRSRVPVAGFETLDAVLTSTSNSTPCKEDNRPLDEFYTSAQRDVILQLLNNAAPSELAGVKLLRGRKSLNIVEYRTKNGPFKTLESVVNVPLLKHKSAVTVFNSILNPVKMVKKGRIQLAKFIRPEVDRSWLEVRFWSCVYWSELPLLHTPIWVLNVNISGMTQDLSCSLCVHKHPSCMRMMEMPDQPHTAALLCHI